MKESIFKVRPFETLTDLRNQYLDYVDRNGPYPTVIEMTKKQAIKYKSLLFYYGKTEQSPETYRGALIRII